MPCFLANDNAVPQTCCPSVGAQLNQLDSVSMLPALAGDEKVGGSNN